jgi:transcriptional regulator with XRE-family HTH domain
MEMRRMKGETDLLTLRFCQVLNEAYDGNLALMAASIGFDRSTLSRYKSGKTPVTQRLMSALANDKGVSLKWLQGGGGDKIEYTKVDEAGSDCSRPVMKTPCEYVPTRSTPGYNGLNRETAPFHNVKTKFWLIAQQNYIEQRVFAGDYVLIREINPGPAKDSDLGQLYIMRRDQNVVFEPVTEQDVKNGVMLFGKAIMCERDLEV